MILTMNLGFILRDWRLHNKITQRDLAKRVDVSQTTLHFFERGGNVDGKTLAKIVRWLLHGEPVAKETLRKKENQP